MAACFQAGLLLMNAAAILNEKRFLWGCSGCFFIYSHGSEPA